MSSVSPCSSLLLTVYTIHTCHSSCSYVYPFFFICITVAYRVFFFFFFSSRRRHTRCSRDWSSDVCSSDLDLLLGLRLRQHGAVRVTRRLRPHRAGHEWHHQRHRRGGRRACEGRDSRQRPDRKSVV